MLTAQVTHAPEVDHGCAQFAFRGQGKHCGLGGVRFLRPHQQKRRCQFGCKSEVPQFPFTVISRNNEGIGGAGEYQMIQQCTGSSGMSMVILVFGQELIRPIHSTIPVIILFRYCRSIALFAVFLLIRCAIGLFHTFCHPPCTRNAAFYPLCASHERPGVEQFADPNDHAVLPIHTGQLFVAPLGID
jgi:hypothetical protein